MVWSGRCRDATQPDTESAAAAAPRTDFSRALAWQRMTGREGDQRGQETGRLVFADLLDSYISEQRGCQTRWRATRREGSAKRNTVQDEKIPIIKDCYRHIYPNTTCVQGFTPLTVNQVFHHYKALWPLPHTTQNNCFVCISDDTKYLLSSQARAKCGFVCVWFRWWRSSGKQSPDLSLETTPCSTLQHTVISVWSPDHAAERTAQKLWLSSSESIWMTVALFCGWTGWLGNDESLHLTERWTFIDF